MGGSAGPDVGRERDGMEGGLSTWLSEDGECVFGLSWVGAGWVDSVAWCLWIYLLITIPCALVRVV